MVQIITYGISLCIYFLRVTPKHGSPFTFVLYTSAFRFFQFIFRRKRMEISSFSNNGVSRYSVYLIPKKDSRKKRKKYTDLDNTHLNEISNNFLYPSVYSITRKKIEKMWKWNTSNADKRHSLPFYNFRNSLSLSMEKKRKKRRKRSRGVIGYHNT